MAAPVLANRNAFFVNYVGTDDPGYNAIGAPWSYRSLAAALAALATVSNPPSATNPWEISIGPGVFTEAAFQLPPWVWITGSADGQGNTLTQINLTGDVTLSSGWAANTTIRGGLANIDFRVGSGTPHLDFTMPVPSAGNPSRTVELNGIRESLALLVFEATGTGDVLKMAQVIQDGILANAITLTAGTLFLNNVISAAAVTIQDKMAIAATAQLNACGLATLAITKSGAGTTVLTDAVSLPINADVTRTGGPTVTLLSDAYGEAYTPANPASWPVVPTTVQQALDDLAGGGGAVGVQAGRVALVNGQQSYAIVFPTPFSAPPQKIDPFIMMASSTGELFVAGVDLTTVTVNGCTIWLNGVPTAASTGGYLGWIAIL